MSFSRDDLAQWMLDEVGAANAAALGVTVTTFEAVADEVAGFMGAAEIGAIDHDLAVRRVARCLLWERILSLVGLAYDSTRGDGSLSRSQMHDHAISNIETFCPLASQYEGSIGEDGELMVGGGSVRQVVHRYVPRRFRSRVW